MIQIHDFSVYNFGNTLYGMRNPLNSWEKADSGGIPGPFKIGENDMRLAQTLLKAGPDHSKFMRQIFVSMDITAPLYWWKEMDTYKVGTVANSESTMHTLLRRPITKDNFSFDTSNDVLVVTKDQESIEIKDAIDSLIATLEDLRLRAIKTKSESYWRALIQLLPESWNQLRTWTANYQVLRNIYFARREHKLKEWKDFCGVIESLPYGKELICYGKGEEK